MTVLLSDIYNYMNKVGTGSAGAFAPGSNLSLGNAAVGSSPIYNPNNVSSTYTIFGNRLGYNPFENTISMGDAQTYYNAGDFRNDIDPWMTFKFHPSSLIAADLYGDAVTYPSTYPRNIGQNGVQMNNTNVSDGAIDGTFTYASNSYTTWTSVAPSDSYKYPNTTNTSATICFWFKPTVQGTLRNFFWADVDAIGDVNPYRGWWFQYNTNNTVGFSRGDGTGAGAPDRRSFTGTATFDGSGNYWQFVSIMISKNENTITTGTNYMWAYVWNGRSYAWSNGATFLSGTGGAMAWSADSGIETTNCFAINPLGNTSAGMVMDIGHIYVFNGELTTTQVEYVREMTDNGYTN